MQSLWPLSGSTGSETLGIGLSYLGKQPPGNSDAESGLRACFRCLIVFWLIFILQPSLVDTFMIVFFVCLFFCLDISLSSTLKNLVNSLNIWLGYQLFQQ